MGRLFRKSPRPDRPLRAAVYGFCHAQALQKILAADPRVAGTLEFVELDECFKMTDEAMNELVGTIAPKLDVLIYQSVSGKTLGKQVSGPEIRALVPDDCLRISFPIFRFDFYTPHFSYPAPEAPKPPFDYLDFGIVDQFLRGTPLSSARPGALTLEFDQHVVDEIRESTLTEIDRRDYDDLGLLSVTLADVVRDRANAEVLFHTINHPGSTLMSALAERTIAALASAGVIDSKGGPIAAGDPFAEIQLPVHPSVQRAIGIPGGGPLIHKGRLYSDEEAVQLTYEYLRSMDRRIVADSMDRFLESQTWAPKLF
jgi:hypothetical protein